MTTIQNMILLKPHMSGPNITKKYYLTGPKMTISINIDKAVIIFHTAQQ